MLNAFVIVALASVAVFSGLVLAMAVRVSRQWREEGEEDLPTREPGA